MNTKLNHTHDWLGLARQANWSVKRMAELNNVSVRTLEMHFLKKWGSTPKAWLTEQRQIQAMKQVRDGRSIKQIAGELGYKNQGHFSTQFKDFWGRCPTQITAPMLRVYV